MIEDTLRADGERWRATQPPPPASIRIATAADRTAWARWAPVAVVAAVVAVLAAVVLPLALRPGTPPTGGPGPGPTTPFSTLSTLPPDTGNGVRVRGGGLLVRDEHGATQFCAHLAIATGPNVSCDPVSVPVTGVDPAVLSHTSTSGGQTYSDVVIVQGIYHAGGLALTSTFDGGALASMVPIQPSHPAPCAAPGGGWPGGAGRADADPHPLAMFVRDHPDRFTDVWQAEPDGVGGPSAQPITSVLSVGTTGDVEAATIELRAYYSGNLCVYRAPYSAADLSRVVTGLTSVSSTPIAATADAEADRVRVAVVAYDAHTAAILDQIGGDAVIVDTMLLNADG